MLCNRMKQFREYNKLDCKLVAEVLGISENEYKDFENNKAFICSGPPCEGEYLEYAL